MSVRDNHRVQRTRVEGELAVKAVGVDALGVEQTAVKQQAIGPNLQKVSAARDLPGRTMKRDSQPTPSRPADDREIRHRAESPGSRRRLDLFLEGDQRVLAPRRWGPTRSTFNSVRLT